MADGAAPRVLLAAAYLTAGFGGIARVARLTARVLVDEGAAVSTLGLYDEAPVRFGGRAATARGSRLAFAARHFAESWRHSHAIYDFAGIARVHWVARPGGLPFAAWMHGAELLDGLTSARLAALRAARLRLVNTQHTLNLVRQGAAGDIEAEVCWLGTEADDAPAPAPPPARPTVFMLGSMFANDKAKGHEELIAIWPAVAAGAPGARLVMAGGGDGVEAIRAVAQASPAAESIAVLGRVSEAEVERLYGEASVFAMPSRGEGFGLVFAEAMRHGLPVVATVHDAGSEVNVDGATGFNVDLGRKGELAAKLITLLREPELAARLGAAGRARWREHFSYSAFRRRLAPLLAGFLGAR